MKDRFKLPKNLGKPIMIILGTQTIARLWWTFIAAARGIYGLR